MVDVGAQLQQAFGTAAAIPQMFVAPLPVDAERYLESCQEKSAESELFGVNHFFSLQQKFVSLSNSRNERGNKFKAYNDAFGEWLEQHGMFYCRVSDNS